MKVFRKVADPLTYTVVGHDGPRSLTPSIVNTFETSIPVRAGDVLGNNSKSQSTTPPTPRPRRVIHRPATRPRRRPDGDLVLKADPLRLNISASWKPTRIRWLWGQNAGSVPHKCEHSGGPVPRRARHACHHVKKKKCKKNKKKHRRVGVSLKEEVQEKEAPLGLWS